MSWLIGAILFVLLVVLDIKFRLLIKKYFVFILLLLTTHIVLICNLILNYLKFKPIIFMVYSIIFSVYFLLRFCFYITSYPVKLKLRIRVMIGGRSIFLISLITSLLQIPISFLLLFFKTSIVNMHIWVPIVDIISVFVLLVLIMIIGILRIIFTSRRLGIVKRIIFIFCLWIPIVNIIIGLLACKIAKQEFIHEYQQTELQNAREESRVCKTKYPLLMLHGIGFRDYKYINYWGRIPPLLIKNGAVIYYGYQQALGTIQDNAEEIKKQILKILEETNCQKINIIAHSKGGLDARYLISSLNMANHIATLTTISTPHRGSDLAIAVDKLPKKISNFLCRLLNNYFKKMGDKNPDCYKSVKQLSPEYLETFNRDNPDSKDVYYQSYAAQMRNSTSHYLLSVPHAILKWINNNNDGLVTCDSAKWGEFKGTFKSKSARGISHADLIDLMRQDYEGFNIAEEYVKIVSELKNNGY